MSVDTGSDLPRDSVLSVLRRPKTTDLDDSPARHGHPRNGLK